MVMLGLARRFARRRPAALVASFLAIGLGALVIAVCGGLLETGIRGDVPPDRLRGAPVVMAATETYLGEAFEERHRADAALLDRLASRQDVRAVVGDVSVPLVTQGRGRRGRVFHLVGHGWSSAQLTSDKLVRGDTPEAQGEAVLSRELARRLHLSIGDRLHVASAGGGLDLSVVGLVTPRSADSLYVTDDQARALLPNARSVDLVALFPTRGVSADELARRLRKADIGAGLRIEAGRDRGLAEFPDAVGENTTLIAMAGASGGLMTGVAVFIVASTLGLSVQLRRRQIALLRAVGTTPAQLRRLILGETLILAVVAAVIAVQPSPAVGRAVLAAFADHGLVADHLVYHQSWIPTIAGIGGAVLTSALSALIAARGMTRIRPVEALASDSSPEPWLRLPRLMLGLLVLAGAVALAIVTALVFDGPVAASTAEPSALLWALALALLAPLILRPFVAVFAPIAACVAPRTGGLAAQTARGRGPRSAGIVIPVMLATGLSTTLLYLQTTQAHATDQAYAESLRADRVLTVPGGQVPLGLADRVARLSGVRAASPLVVSSGFFNPDPGTHPEDANPIPLQGVDAAGAAALTAYQVRAGSLGRLTGNTVAIAQSERQRGRGLGDVVSLRFGDGRSANLRVVAVIATRRGYPTLLLPADLLARHTTTGLADQILIATGAESPATATRLNDRLRSLYPGLVVSDRAHALDLFADQQQTGAWVGYLFIAALVLYTGISLVNTTITVTSQRRPQFRSLRLLGAARHQVIRAMTIEALVLAAAGSALGTMFALATLLPFDSALGEPGLPSGPWWIYPTIVGSATALTVLIARITTAVLDTRPLQS